LVGGTAQEEFLADGDAGEEHDVIDPCEGKDFPAVLVRVVDADGVALQVQGCAGGLDAESVE
jgi:hypothetical protein